MNHVKGILFSIYTSIAGGKSFLLFSFSRHDAGTDPVNVERFRKGDETETITEPEEIRLRRPAEALNKAPAERARLPRPRKRGTAESSNSV